MTTENPRGSRNIHTTASSLLKQPYKQKTASDGNLNVSSSTVAANNYDAPSVITPNRNGSLSNTYAFDGSLELTGVTMPSGATCSSVFSA